MDSNFALYQNFVQVGGLGQTFSTPIVNGAQFNTKPFKIGEGNRCKLVLATRFGNPYGAMTSFELYFTWYATDPQRFVDGVNVPPLPTNRFDALESMDVAGSTPDQRIHDLKYYTYRFPLTAPPIPLVPPQQASDFVWDIVAPMDFFVASVKIAPIGPYTGSLVLYAAPGANAQ